jgi:ABC-type uncharacterized transport system substrate-binding protein
MSKPVQCVPFILAFVTCCTPLPATAHPHVWVEMESSVVTNAQGFVDAVALQWTFDEAYAQAALEGLDADGDGAYSEAELEPLTKENVASLKEYDYFMVVRQNAEKLALKDVTEFSQVCTDGRLKLLFKVPLTAPADPKSGEVMIKVYDPEFFVAFDYVKETPVSVFGTLPQGCAMELKPLKTDAEAEETLAMLAAKGKEWKPEQEEDFGAMFAQPLVVACTS